MSGVWRSGLRHRKLPKAGFTGCRAISCSGVQAESKGPTPDNKAYSKTLLLPKTKLTLRSDPLESEVPFRNKTTRDLYQWQWDNAKGPLFVLHDGPPYANGHLHMGHALNKIVKDIIVRYKVLMGHKVHYHPGWDCHGLPIENKVLQQLGKDQRSIDSKTIRDAARKYAEQEVQQQREEFSQLGIMADWSSGTTYRTMDHAYEMRQLQVFKTMVEAGLVYRHYRPVHYSPSSGSALAEAELTYKDDHVSHSVYVAFHMDTKGESMRPILKTLLASRPDSHLLVWTTTPWTLTANMGIAVHPELKYSILSQKKTGKTFIVGSTRVFDLTDILGEVEEIAQVEGSELVDSTYYPLFFPVAKDVTPRYPLRILPSNHVTADSGTGLVHCAPAHGAEDYMVFRSLDLLKPREGSSDTGMFCHVDAEGKFSSKVSEVVGESVGRKLVGKEVLKDGNKAIIEVLGDMGVLVKVQKIKHRYPYDWKTDQPIIMLATSQWFADLNSIKGDALKTLDSVSFFPAGSRRRLQSFVQNRSEWCISRQRVWGVPIPALYHVPTDTAIMDGVSLKHILSVLGTRGTAHWWDGSVEDFVPPHLRKEGEDLAALYRKGTDTMDVWFDSGTSWTMLRDLVKNADAERPYYADVCVEGTDQHRGWFQSQLLTAVAATKAEGRVVAPYKHLITHGMVLDPVGKKMSKSLGNIISPMTVISGGKDKKKEPPYGADTLRLWAATVEYWNDAAIGSNVLAQCALSLRKIRNSARFILGVLEDGRSLECLERVAVGSRNMSLADRYVLHELTKLDKVAREGYATYNFAKVVNAMSNFCNVTLSSLYFDVTKDCLYADARNSAQRRAVLTVLEQVLRTMVFVMAPILPHLAEDVHHVMSGAEDPASGRSVFTTTWEPLPSEWENPCVEGDMNRLLSLRTDVLALLEKARRNKNIGSSLEADVEILVRNQSTDIHPLLRREQDFLRTLFIVSDVSVHDETPEDHTSLPWKHEADYGNDLRVVVRPANLTKCPRCWTFTRHPEEILCRRCADVIKV
ncbi:isoleucyl-tRNA synthetase [Gloeophyllum trabeum ATCC 11539]|uniref:Isoleucine--tRNA ligase, mitochondrial n=1 Tax=Gloeophyllum trabeum (strain ATCC 11539 / FP-39264 / Madison 617) TaxID=670483 RepID=S7Q138_GLOTA|nr:isoleucyl-tRNA synthetase [Gloeophyllum trabeum ATCC 11539]EPQ53661.1 isoleucyl-tRNA synthetase [Gloeophyllum trabeum ATCC 11539]